MSVLHGILVWLAPDSHSCSPFLCSPFRFFPFRVRLTLIAIWALLMKRLRLCFRLEKAPGTLTAYAPSPPPKKKEHCELDAMKCNINCYCCLWAVAVFHVARNKRKSRENSCLSHSLKFSEQKNWRQKPEIFVKFMRNSLRSRAVKSAIHMHFSTRENT